LSSFSAEDQQFLLVFASQAATAIANGGLPRPKPKEEVSQRELRSDSFFGLRSFLCCTTRGRERVVTTVKDGETQVSGSQFLMVPQHSTRAAVPTTTTSARTQADGEAQALGSRSLMVPQYSTGAAVPITTTPVWTQAEVSITSPRLVIPSPCVSDGESEDDMDDCFEEVEVARFLAEAFDSWTMDANRLVQITGNRHSAPLDATYVSAWALCRNYGSNHRGSGAFSRKLSKAIVRLIPTTTVHMLRP